MKMDEGGRTREKLKNVFSGGNRNANRIITFEIAHSTQFASSRSKLGQKGAEESTHFMIKMYEPSVH